VAYCLRANPGQERGGQQLSTGTRSSTPRVKGAHDIITAIAAAAGLEDDTTVHVLRHTFATTHMRGDTDLVIVAGLLGHARLETTRGYTRPTAEDRTRALDLLLVDE
jgi:site-specific recombinase XerD